MILFITPYPRGTAASQRFRFEQYYAALEAEGIPYEILPFWEYNAWEVLYAKRKTHLKLYFLLKGIIKRWGLVYKSKKEDYLFIHRELYPTGIKFLIFVLSRVLKRKIIYDFDDAIWLPNNAVNNSRFAFIKSYGQVASLCKYADKLSVGNGYLKAFGLQYNNNVVVNPTTIDTENLHNRITDYNYTTLNIGWTGTHSTLKYVEPLLPVLDALYQNYNFKLTIISDGYPGFERDYVNDIPWVKDTEIDDLLTINVGIMPLTDDKWAWGKCGFKALQYMSLGIPAIVSPVGVNTDIVDHDTNGWVCDSSKDWEEQLEIILKDLSVSKTMGVMARQKIVESYSVQSNTNNFLNLFK